MTTVTGVSEFVAGAGNGHRLQWRLTMVTGQGTSDTAQINCD